jgi:hypothetical protein
VAEAFLKDEITIGHALLIAKLPASQQQEAFSAAFRGLWTSEGNSQVLIPVRELAAWVESNILLQLASAPFDKQDETLVPEAGSCVNCPKRTGFNKLLFPDVRKDSCTSPDCFRAKIDASVKKALETKPQLIQISAPSGDQSAERRGRAALETMPRSRITECKSRGVAPSSCSFPCHAQLHRAFEWQSIRTSCVSGKLASTSAGSPERAEASRLKVAACSRHSRIPADTRSPKTVILCLSAAYRVCEYINEHFRVFLEVQGMCYSAAYFCLLNPDRQILSTSYRKANRAIGHTLSTRYQVTGASQILVSELQALGVWNKCVRRHARLYRNSVEAGLFKPPHGFKMPA